MLGRYTSYISPCFLFFFWLSLFFMLRWGSCFLQGTVLSTVEDSFSLSTKLFPSLSIYHNYQITVQVTAYYFHPKHMWVCWCMWKLEILASIEMLCYLGQEKPGCPDTSQSNKTGIESLISFLSSISLYPWPQVVFDIH